MRISLQVQELNRLRTVTRQACLGLMLAREADVDLIRVIDSHWTRCDVVGNYTGSRFVLSLCCTDQKCVTYIRTELGWPQRFLLFLTFSRQSRIWIWSLLFASCNYGHTKHWGSDAWHRGSSNKMIAKFWCQFVAILPYSLSAKDETLDQFEKWDERYAKHQSHCTADIRQVTRDAIVFLFFMYIFLAFGQGNTNRGKCNVRKVF